MSERKAGWYWIVANGEWEPSYYNGTDWSGMDDEDFEHIGPRIPSPDEPWQCVPIDPTPEMAQAGTHARMNIQGGYGGPSPWEAMLAVAPKP